MAKSVLKLAKSVVFIFKNIKSRKTQPEFYSFHKSYMLSIYNDSIFFNIFFRSALVAASFVYSLEIAVALPV